MKISNFSHALGPVIKNTLLTLLDHYHELGISGQIDYDKFYLYSLITHSTAIEGSTVTEVEAQLLFEEGITSSKRTIAEQMMNLDLKNAYDYGREWIKKHQPITIDWLIALAAKVMAHTGSEYNTINGSFSAAKGELRLLNVTAGFGGKSYMSYTKVQAKLQSFCNELNLRRAGISPKDVFAVYELSYWAHYELVTIHPWADGNGRMSRLLMNLLQMEFDVLPTKVLQQDKAEYIQALIDAREQDDIPIFTQYMHRVHIEHLQHDIDQYQAMNAYKMADKREIAKELVGKWSIKASLAEKLADILLYMVDKDEIKTEQLVSTMGYTETTARRYLRQLSAFGYLVPGGGNRNRTYKRINQ